MWGDPLEALGILLYTPNLKTHRVEASLFSFPEFRRPFSTQERIVDASGCPPIALRPGFASPLRCARTPGWATSFLLEPSLCPTWLHFHGCWVSEGLSFWCLIMVYHGSMCFPLSLYICIYIIFNYWRKRVFDHPTKRFIRMLTHRTTKLWVRLKIIDPSTTCGLVYLTGSA